MKKRNLILLFLISLFVLPICVFAEEEINYTVDDIDVSKLDFDVVDINDDGYVGDGDIMYLRLHMAGKEKYNCEGINCDVTGDGKVNMKDLLAVRKWIYKGADGKYDISKYDYDGDGTFQLIGDFESAEWQELVEDGYLKAIGEDESYWKNKSVTDFTEEAAKDIHFDDVRLRLFVANIVSTPTGKEDVNGDGVKGNMKDILRVRKGIVKSDLIEDTPEEPTPEEPTPEEPEAKEETTDNPDTGVFYKYGIVALLGVLASAGYVVTRKNKKFPKRG